jgi:hypothetical protein
MTEPTPIGRSEAPSRVGRHARLLLAAALLLGVLTLRHQTLRMDWIFFQPSWAGAKGLVFYLAGDYGSNVGYSLHLKPLAAADIAAGRFVTLRLEGPPIVGEIVAATSNAGDVPSPTIWTSF